MSIYLYGELAMLSEKVAHLTHRDLQYRGF